ncbi:hypothetical protein UlMin_006430 [Ulmus minor]
MELNSATNTFKCRAFVITLTGVARRWFRTLLMKDEVERLIQRGQLREYVRGTNQQPRQPAQPTARPQPQDNHDLELRTIMGGPATGETNRARKNYARQSRTDPFPHKVNMTEHKEKIPRLSDDPIIFTESEARGLWHPHTDAIVVTLRIAGRKVFRILVDNGSSADILFKSTFKRMNLVGVKVEPTASSLSGFTGDSISSEGILNLPIELGSSPCQHIQAVDFVLGSYEGIKPIQEKFMKQPTDQLKFKE